MLSYLNVFIFFLFNIYIMKYIWEVFYGVFIKSANGFAGASMSERYGGFTRLLSLRPVSKDTA